MTMERPRPSACSAYSNIVSASTYTGRDRIAKLRFTFELADAAHLTSILSAVKRVDGVFDAYRLVPS